MHFYLPLLPDRLTLEVGHSKLWKTLLKVKYIILNVKIKKLYNYLGKHFGNFLKNINIKL